MTLTRPELETDYTLGRSDIAHFREHGFVKLKNVLSADTIAEYEPEITGKVIELNTQDVPLEERDTYGKAFLQVTNLWQDSERVLEFVSSPRLARIAAQLLGVQSVRLYHDQAVYKRPEKPRRFPWHQDNGYTFVEPQQYLTCWVALTDATVDNGCPHVVPGLHRLGTLRHRFADPLGWEIFEDHPDAISAPVAKGGIVVFSSLSPHLTGPNTTGAVRKAYILQYAPDGAVVYRGDAALPKPEPEPANDAARQFPVLVGGERVAPPPH